MYPEPRTRNPCSWTPHIWVEAFFLDSQRFESDRLIFREPVEWLFGPGTARPHGYNGYWINVPRGATQLGIHLVTATQDADVDLYAANRELGGIAAHPAAKTMKRSSDIKASTCPLGRAATSQS